jgi:glycogen(starch) synthase
VVIYNPIREYFRPLANSPITSDFAFFGRMNFEKGATDLLDALQLCNTKGHRFTADLYGEGWMLKDFQARAAKLGLEGQVRWHPFRSGEDLVQAMNSARVVVVPSKWIEPMGIVAVEAMACGKCVIGSSAGGLGEVLSGYCPTYPNQNIEELAKQMIALMSDSHLRSGYEAAALRRAGEFQKPKKIAADYLNYFQKVLS